MSEQGTPAPQQHAIARTFEPLPDPERDQRAEFYLHLAALINLIGAEPPLEVAPSREWEWNARATVREAVSDREHLPEELFDALLRSGVHDPNPSFNRQFIEPAVAAFGRRRVKKALIDYLRNGSNLDRAGAARAWYWTAVGVSYLDWEAKIITPESQTELDAVADLSVKWQQTALHEFVGNDDLDVRRCILPGLSLDVRRYPVALHELVAEAVHIARSHSDEYIRHRVEHQVG